MLEDRIVFGIVAILLVLGIYFLFMSKKESHNTGESELPNGAMELLDSGDDEEMGEEEEENVVLL